jgi:signal transduction histidine kinase
MLEIRDNGMGFNVTEKKQASSSLSGVGLKSMFNRAKLIGADISMASEAGEGTTILIELPLS